MDFEKTFAEYLDKDWFKNMPLEKQVTSLYHSPENKNGDSIYGLFGEITINNKLMEKETKNTKIEPILIGFGKPPTIEDLLKDAKQEITTLKAQLAEAQKPQLTMATKILIYDLLREEFDSYSDIDLIYLGNGERLIKAVQQIGFFSKARVMASDINIDYDSI